MTKEEHLYKMLSNFTHIMYCAERDYKPFVQRDLEEQISEVYSQINPNVLRDWFCPACAIYNWKQFSKWYRKYQKELKEKSDLNNNKKNHTQNGKKKINENK